MNDKLQTQFDAWKAESHPVGVVTSGQLRQATQRLKNYGPDGVPVMTAELATFLLSLPDEQ